MSSRSKDKQRQREERLADERAKRERSKRQRLKLVGSGVFAVIAIAAVAVAVAAGGGGEGGVSQTSSAPRPSKAELNSLPKPLAENISMANVIVDEGVPALQDRLAKLRGYPVVVHQWASWCPPCRAEIPLFQKAAQQYQGKVAFLGIDRQDSRGPAEDFLSELPMPYPSIWDPDSAAISSLGGGQVSPTTALVDERGDVVFTRQGQYPDLPTLRADIQRLLGS
ncbi:MAG TPA: TlpA disulfide reductase family protein [Solirubrobacterales bacterium]|nr:TlpA disulfide reductase family protein [Solirubrobacterales bacterium]